MPPLHLSQSDRAMLDGRRGEAAGLAMRLVVRLAELRGARRLIDIASAHVDGCLYQGPVSLDFAERLAASGARVSVPTTLNVGAIDLLHPHLYRGDPATARRARRLMELYADMGCRPTWTCAPYQIPEARPAFGQHVAWAESNAIAFANSVLGARTDRYGDFIDICAAITGRVPESGLHLDRNRRGQILFRVRGIPRWLLEEDVVYPLLGLIVGRTAGTSVPVIEGLPPGLPEDRLKALGAAAASSGSVGLFHVLGGTPEAPAMESVFPDGIPEPVLDITPRDLAEARRGLEGPDGERLAAVSVGTPHFSVDEFGRLVELLGNHGVHPGTPLYVSTGRQVLDQVERFGWTARLEAAGVTVVTDTCTYITPILDRPLAGTVMTNSAKWAYYAPANLGVRVVFATLEECVRSAVSGKVWRDERLWSAVG